MLGRISLALLAITVGLALTLVGFYAYATDNATLNLAGFFYGIPVLLGGLALKSAELAPTPITAAASPEVLALRDQEATPTLKQVRADVTRYRYGQGVHLEPALEKLGLSPTDEERPQLVGLREESRDGHYALVLDFESPLMPLETWQAKGERIGRFFGPGVRAELQQPQAEHIELALIVQPSS
jgi:hypothetical protein